jgi:hypothetical protein
MDSSLACGLLTIAKFIPVVTVMPDRISFAGASVRSTQKAPGEQKQETWKKSTPPAVWPLSLRARMPSEDAHENGPRGSRSLR